MMRLTLKAESLGSDLTLAVLAQVESCRNKLLIAASCDNQVLTDIAIEVLDDLDSMLLSLDNQGIISLGERVIS